MTDKEIRDVFSGFQNLNLLCLIEDLKVPYRVAKKAWILGLHDYGSEDDPRRRWPTLCPIAHGWAGTSRGQNSAVRCQFAGVPLTVADKFISWWDNNNVSCWLLEVLEGIYQERLDDADAVQEVIDHESLREVLV